MPAAAPVPQAPGNARRLLNAVYAAATAGMDGDERRDFDDALGLRHRVVMPSPTRALPPAKPALRAVPDPDPQRFSAERLAAIRSLGGDVTTREGA